MSVLGWRTRLVSLLPAPHSWRTARQCITSCPIWCRRLTARTHCGSSSSGRMRRAPLPTRSNASSLSSPGLGDTTQGLCGRWRHGPEMPAARVGGTQCLCQMAIGHGVAGRRGSCMNTRWGRVCEPESRRHGSVQVLSRPRNRATVAGLCPSNWLLMKTNVRVTCDGGDLRNPAHSRRTPS
jgi:hypothetical protein